MSRRNTLQTALLAGLTIVGTSAGAAVVNLDVTTSMASLAAADPLNPYAGYGGIAVTYQDLTLAAGTYTATPIAPPATGASFVAATRWNYTDGCNVSGVHCQVGWANSYYLKVGSDAPIAVGPNPAGGYAPVYFQTANLAFANAVAASFTVTSPGTNVRFYWLDDTWTDNAGGISLNVSPVPEPGQWAMMAAGLAFVGVIARRRRADARSHPHQNS